MEFLQKPVFRWAVFGVLSLIAFAKAFIGLNAPDKSTNGYDEQMWTSSSITSYHMYAKGYLRPTQSLDNWFPSYAYKNGIDIFKDNIGTLADKNGNAYPSNKIFWDGKTPQDSILFPRDLISYDTANTKVGMIVEYDTVKFPRKDFQWYDAKTWTFGWKAPNVGKYIMGWYITTFSSEKPDPNGYFENFLPTNQADTTSDEYKPSTTATGAPFSYAPQQYVQLARVPNAFFTVLIIMAVFLIGWHVFNFWTGFAASAWLLLNTAFFTVNTAAGLDSFSTFFSTISVFLLILLIEGFRKNFTWWKSLLIAVVSAVMIGFAIGSKLNSGLLVFINIIVFAGAGLLILLDLWKNRKNKPGLKSLLLKLGTLIMAGLISGLFSIAIFIRLNPQVQGESMKKITTMRESIDDYFTERAPKINLQQTQQGHKTYKWIDIKNNWGDAFSLTMKRIAVVNDEPENFSKNYYGTFGSLLHFHGNFLDGLFAFLGFIFVLITAYKGLRKESWITGAFVFLVASVVLIYGNVDFLWQDWSRYFTPMFPVYSIFIGFGIVQLVQLVISRRKKKPAVVSPVKPAKK